ncbi:MAG: lipopolysaccharide biosynthesis protein [Alphaproteobacteria bacterium]
MKDIVSSFTATALIQAANIASGVMLARFLLPEGRGELAAVILWPSVIGAIGIFGLHEAVAFHAARRPRDAAGILRAGLALGLGLSLLLMPLAALAADWVFATARPEVREAAFLYVLFIPLHFIASISVGLFQGMLRFAEWNLLRVLIHAVYALLIPLFYALDWGGVQGFAVASLLSLAAVAAAGVLGGARAGWLTRGTIEASVGRNAPSLLKYGVSVHVGATVAIIAERLDQMIISLALSAADLGLFVVALTVARLPLVAASTLGTVAFPKIAAAEESEKARIFGRYTRATMILVLSASLALAAVMPWLLTGFFGGAFADAVPLAWVLLVAAVPLSLKTMISSGLKGYDRGVLVGQTEIVTLAASAAALALLVPTFGLMGAAWASVLAQTAALAFLLARVARATGVGVGDLLLPRRADLAVVGDMAAALWARVAGRTGGAG